MPCNFYFSDRTQWVRVFSEQQWHDNFSSTIKNCSEYLKVASTCYRLLTFHAENTRLENV